MAITYKETTNPSLSRTQIAPYSLETNIPRENYRTDKTSIKSKQKYWDFLDNFLSAPVLLKKKGFQYKLIEKPTLPPNLIEMIQYLVKLTRIDPTFQDEDEILNPSNYAVSQSFYLLIQLHRLLGDVFPRGYASLESRGGVNLIWCNQEFDKEVRVEIPVSSEFRAFIYYCDDDNDRLIKEPSAEKIAEILIWLSSEKSVI